jgi:hypothetical protein
VPAPKTLLPLLLGGAVGLGGILQGLHWRSETRALSLTDSSEKLRAAEEQIAILKRENESLRSLAQGGGELAVPRELIGRAEKEFGLRFLSNPVVHRIVSEELRDRVAAAIESRLGPSGIDDRRDAWRLMGLIGAEDDLLAQLSSVRALGARGWFDDMTGEAWVTDRFQENNIPDQAALVRLLARVLLHQNFPPPPAYPGDDAARAREALHQGAAAGSEARFFAANARAIGFMPMTENPDVARLMAGLPDFIRGLTTFPVIEGKGLADTLHVQGNENFQAAFRNPPQTTRAILVPGETPVAPAALEPLALPEEAYLTETAGQLGLRLWLGASSTDIAASWRNDRYVLFPDGEASSALLWDIELADKNAADKFHAVASERISAMLATQEKRHLRVARISPTRIRFLNTAVAATADKLGSP